MEFCRKAKAELVRKPSPCRGCQLALLSALVHSAGSIEIARSELSISVEVDHAAVARLIFSLFKEQHGVYCEVMVKRVSRLNKTSRYVVRVAPAGHSTKILQTLMIFEGGVRPVPGIKRELISSNCCKRAYLKGVFLARGYVTDPSKSYHLELVVSDHRYGEALCKLLKAFEIRAGISQNKERYQVYVKDASGVADFLQVVGADSALMDLESMRVMKSVRNSVNRTVNCETANVSRSVEASLAQLSDVELIQKTVGLGRLRRNLRDTAEARVEMPSATLGEIGKAMDPTVSRSTVAYRFRQIRKLADSLRDGSTEER